MLRGLVALVCFGLVARSECARNQRRHKGFRSHHAVQHSSHHSKQPVPQGWSLPPLSKIFRGSQKTVDSLEHNMNKLKNAVSDLRGKNLEQAKETYTGFVQALMIDDEQDQKLQADNNEVEKKINALELSNKAEAQRRDMMVRENAKLTKQLEELKKTVNTQVDGLEGILKNGMDVPRATEATPAASVSALVQVQTVVAPHISKSASLITPPQAVSLIQTSKKDSEDDDDEDSDEDDDSKSVKVFQPACRCRTACRDEGWGMWCYLQSANCRVKEQCEMGGAANACVADDPGGPWTRCSNLLVDDAAAPASPAASQPQFAPPAAVTGAAQPAVQQTFTGTASAGSQQTFTINAQPVKDILVKLMTQVDDIRTEDQQSNIKMQEIYQSETAKMQAKRNAIQQKQTELAARLREVKGDSAKLAAQVDHLEEVNRSLHMQLHRLERFLSSASSELHGSIESEDHVAAAAALQISKKDKDDDDDDDDDDDSDEKDDN